MRTLFIVSILTFAVNIGNAQDVDKRPVVSFKNMVVDRTTEEGASFELKFVFARTPDAEIVEFAKKITARIVFGDSQSTSFIEVRESGDSFLRLTVLSPTSVAKAKVKAFNYPFELKLSEWATEGSPAYEVHFRSGVDFNLADSLAEYFHEIWQVSNKNENSEKWIRRWVNERPVKILYIF